MDYKKIMLDILKNGIDVDMDRETSIEFFERLHGFLLKEVSDPVKIFLEEENLIVVESKYFYPIFSIKYFDGVLFFTKQEDSLTMCSAHGIKNVIMKTLQFIKEISEIANAMKEEEGYAAEISPSEEETSEYSEEDSEEGDKNSSQEERINNDSDEDSDDDSDDDSELWL